MVTLPIVPSLFLSLLILPVPIVAETQNFLRFQRRLALQPNFIQLGSNEYPLNNSRVLAKREADGSRLYKPLPLSAKDSDFIVAEHNKYRRMTPATNIRLIRWNTTLAASAQYYAEMCRFNHSPGQIRPGSGENIWAAPWQDFNAAVQMWYNEVYLRDCGCNNGYKHCCGHYTQVVWADSHQIGCGLAQCNSVEFAPGERFVLICHYYPAGNVVTVDRDSRQYVSYPAFEVRTKEKPVCSGCPTGSACDNGLCA